MALVTGKCTNCGAKIEVESTQVLGVCSFCHLTYYVEKVICNYKSSTESKTTAEIKVEALDIDSLLKEGVTFIEIGEFKKAEEVYRKVTEADPQNYRGWVGMVKAVTCDYTDPFAPTVYEDYYKNALKVADNLDKGLFIKDYDSFLSRVKTLKRKDYRNYLKMNVILIICIILFFLFMFVLPLVMLLIKTIQGDNNFYLFINTLRCFFLNH